ncbi:hypothetical protein [Azospirillum brasilense]|uniref:hypothetical protein n=1 Tax=Azospirillum brasilense TaxID=192 RepID=UPI0011F01254|nr:hypothetical protein [Azospirillum brasilense]
MFIPTKIARVVERSLSLPSRYLRLNVVVDQTKAHFIAFVEIAFVCILSRRLRLTTRDICA